MIKNKFLYLNTNIVTIKIYMPSKVVILRVNMHVHSLAGKGPIIENEVYILLVIFIHTYKMHKCKYQKYSVSIKNN